jgi:hypothetical protein
MLFGNLKGGGNLNIDAVDSKLVLTDTPIETRITVDETRPLDSY